jgi:hypothetical protein
VAVKQGIRQSAAKCALSINNGTRKTGYSKSGGVMPQKMFVSLLLITAIVGFMAAGCSRNTNPAASALMDATLVNNGLNVTDSIYSASGKLINYKIYEFDGVLNRTKQSFYNGNGTLLGYMVYESDKNGWTNKESRYNQPGTLDSYVVNDFNNNGRLTKASYYSGNGVLTGYDTWEYSARMWMTKYSGFDGAGILQVYRLFEYDTQGREIKEQQYDGLGALQTVKVFAYNTGDYNSSVSIYDSSGVLQLFDGAVSNAKGGFVRDDSFYGSGKLRGYTLWEYDNIGRATKYSIYDGTGALTNYEVYVYSGIGLNTGIFNYTHTYPSDILENYSIYDNKANGL